MPGCGVRDAARPGCLVVVGGRARPVSQSGAVADALVAKGGPVLADLAALTPPLLVCVAFLIAVWAFLRHEMRTIKNPSGEDEADEPSTRRDSDESA